MLRGLQRLARRLDAAAPHVTGGAAMSLPADPRFRICRRRLVYLTQAGGLRHADPTTPFPLGIAADDSPVGDASIISVLGFCGQVVEVDARGPLSEGDELQRTVDGLVRRWAGTGGHSLGVWVGPDVPLPGDEIWGPVLLRVI